MSLANPYNIQIQPHFMGKDLAFMITGGEAHIGAVATAYMKHENLIVDINELPHHKEGALAKECAELATRTLGYTTSVLMGIHIDNASREEIEQIVSFVRKAMKETVEKLKNKELSD